MIRKLAYLSVLLILLLVSGASALFLSAFSREPEITYSERFTSDAYDRAEAFTQHLTSALSQDQLNRLEVTAPDIEDLLFYSASKLRINNKKLMTIEGVNVKFSEDEFQVGLTLKAPVAKSAFLNFKMVISEFNHKPQLNALYFGDLKVPGVLISTICKWFLEPLLSESNRALLQRVTGSVKKFVIDNDRLILVYRTDSELREALKANAAAIMLGDPREKEILELYLSVFTAAALQQSTTEYYLSPILRTMVGLAKSRSENGGSAVKENERMLRAMAIQVADTNTRVLLAPGIQPKTLRSKVLLRGRSDLTQHFLVSAALTLVLDETSVLEIGVSKEKRDSKAGGSGFSFPDLLADLAGIRFAVAATRSEEDAKAFQNYLLATKGEQAFMPEIHWLPQGLTALAYQDLIRHPFYPAMLKQMLGRLNRIPLYNL